MDGQDALYRRFDAIIAFVARLEMAQAMIVIEKIVCGHELIFESVHDRMGVIDSARLREAHGAARIRFNASEIQFLGRTRLMYRDEQ
jgi:hypothetical protein